MEAEVRFSNDFAAPIHADSQFRYRLTRDAALGVGDVVVAAGSVVERDSESESFTDPSGGRLVRVRLTTGGQRHLVSQRALEPLRAVPPYTCRVVSHAAALRRTASFTHQHARKLGLKLGSVSNAAVKRDRGLSCPACLRYCSCVYPRSSLQLQ